MPSQSTPTFDLFALRYHFTAQSPVSFPRNQTVNLFRGQIGRTLHRRDPAAYARIFAPIRETGVASGLHNPPRPFVLRVRHLDGATLRDFPVGVNLFETDHSTIDAAVIEVARENFRADFARVEGEQALHLSLVPSRTVTQLRLNFLSPTEFKNFERPLFGQLFARVRDRISTLRAMYGAGPLEIDFKAMGERAAAIHMTRCEIQSVDGERTSRSSGRSHPLSGFIGVAEYEGDLTEFVPYLEIAGYTGVGRQTVWGKGEVSVETF